MAIRELVICDICGKKHEGKYKEVEIRQRETKEIKKKNTISTAGSISGTEYSIQAAPPTMHICPDCEEKLKEFCEKIKKVRSCCNCLHKETRRECLTCTVGFSCTGGASAPSNWESDEMK